MDKVDDDTLRQFSKPRKKQPRPESAGQSGHDIGLSRTETAGSESVAELVEEGQFFEAEAGAGLDTSLSRRGTRAEHEVNEDDASLEYPSRDAALDND